MPFSDAIPSPADLVQQARNFMRLYFGGNLEGAWMCAFNDDPGLGGNWTGMAATKALDSLPDFITLSRGFPPNLYWSPYRYRGGVRGGDNFIEAVAIVVDDVGSQVDVDAADRRHEAALQRFREGVLAEWKAKPVATRGPKPKPPKREGVKIAAEKMMERIGPPTTALETSANNWQWFYRLDVPCRDKAQLRAVLMAIGSDAKDLARVMRCPGGANWKAGALIDGKPFIGRVSEASSGDVYKITDMLAAVGADVHPETERHRPSSAEEKIEVQALREAGLLLSSAETANPETRGSIWMTCPGHLGGEEEGGWPGAEIGHSAGMDQGRARVWPHGGFKCFHDSCRNRNFNHLGPWIERHPDAGPIFGRLKHAQVAVELPPLPIDEDDDDDIIGDDAPRVVYVRPGELPYQTREVVKALRARRHIYYYGRKTVQVLDLVERDGIGGKVKAAQITRLSDVSVAQRLLEGVVDWWRYDGRSRQDVRCNVPPRVAANICNSVDLDFEEITGIIKAPFLRANGTIGGLQDGYDRQTGLWVDHAGVAYRPVLDADCTQANAQAALRRLDKLLSEYRFAEPVGKAAALAALLTPLARPAVSLVPMFGIDAPVIGSGKTKLALSIAALMTGLAPALVQGTGDTKELDKRINGVLMTGEQCVVVDNLIGKGWGSSDLCSAVTAERINIRPLGKSPPVPVKNTFIVFLTGNNLVIEGEVVRRILVIRIDPGVAQPARELHSFDPVEYVREHRADMVHDALLILRAYTLAGRPTMGGHEIGSFGAWARIVRDALMWLGEPDVADAMPISTVSNAPEFETLLPAWAAAFGENKQNAKRSRDLVQPAFGSNNTALQNFSECLRDLVLSTGPDRKISEAAWLGTWLGARRDQQGGGFKLRRRILKGVPYWYVEDDGENPID